MKIDFPSSFLWGAALSSYQCEGGNYNSDWYLWEQARKLTPAGAACGHYRLFEQDFSRAAQLNLKALRISVEWARICPERGAVAAAEVEHYQQVAETLLKFKLKPLVTLHHFTNPIWFEKQGGWLSAKNIDFFLTYLKVIVEALRGKADLWFVFNEPLVYIYNGFIRGIWPPGVKSVRLAGKVLRNISDAYLAGYQEIKRLYNGRAPAEVSFTKNMIGFCACPDKNSWLNSFSSFTRDRIFNFSLLDYLHKKRALDFIALNYYSKQYVRFKGLLGEECGHTFHRERRNYLDGYVYPQGLYEILMRLKKFKLPVVISENGTAEIKDCFYQEYLTAHLRGMARAYAQGVDIRGYLWWSLLDNFEWDKGFGPRFGLLEVDYVTQQRKARPFAAVYAKICKENAVEIS